MTSPEDDAVLRAAVDSEEVDYPDAEALMLSRAADTGDFSAAMEDDDALTRLAAHAVLDAAETEQGEPGKLAAVDAYLAKAERWFAPTVLGSPPVRGVVDNLTASLGGRLAALFALRLLKLPGAPPWRQQVALGYLEENHTPTATEAILRYATATTTPDGLRQAAVRTLRATGDPQLPAKARAERDRLTALGTPVPNALKSLLT